MRALGLLGRRALRRSERVRPPTTRGWSSCYAPHSSMYFDQFGKVRACCQNTGVYLGDTTRESLREIWESADAERMRVALESDDYSVGCDFCAWQVREGNDDVVFARGFDELEPVERRPTWPSQMEFSLSNACNLQCAMCNGDLSSAIRTHREHRAPLPVVYGEAFYEQLAEFLPHLRKANFLGGEPFLGKEALRVMEMLADLSDPADRPDVTITTNGTIFTPRVERILDQLHPAIVISIDGATPESYDSVRIGAHLPDVLANLDRFSERVGPDRVSITHCLMTTNWHEFADLLRIAEERGIHVGVNVVRAPSHLSVYQLPLSGLEPIVDELLATPVDLTGNRLQMWQGHVSALAHRVEALRVAAQDPTSDAGIPGTPVPVAIRPKGPDGAVGDPPPRVSVAELVAPRGPEWVPFLVDGEGPTHRPEAAPQHTVARIGVDGVVSVVHLEPAAPVDLEPLDGRNVFDIEAVLIERYGPTAFWELEASAGPDGPLRVRPGGPDGPGGLQISVHADRDESGRLVGGWFHFGPAAVRAAVRTPDPTS